jgi:hypothetical protein
LAKELLLNRAIQTNCIHNKKVTETSLKPGAWVLIRHEDPKKLKSRWFRLYQVLKAHPLRIYALAEPGG